MGYFTGAGAASPAGSASGAISSSGAGSGNAAGTSATATAGAGAGAGPGPRPGSAGGPPSYGSYMGPAGPVSGAQGAGVGVGRGAGAGAAPGGAIPPGLSGVGVGVGLPGLGGAIPPGLVQALTPQQQQQQFQNAYMRSNGGAGPIPGQGAHPLMPPPGVHGLAFGPAPGVSSYDGEEGQDEEDDEDEDGGAGGGAGGGENGSTSGRRGGKGKEKEGGGEKSGTGKEKSTADFVRKLFSMLEDGSWNDVVRWSLQGDSFVVVNMSEFTKHVLPRHFRHSNFASFVRQLNKYDFHKMKKNAAMFEQLFGMPPGSSNGDFDQMWEFKNDCFVRGRPDLLDGVRRKLPTGKKVPRNSTGLDGTGNANGTNGNGEREDSPAVPLGAEAAERAAEEYSSLKEQVASLTMIQDQMTHHIGTLTKQYQNVIGEMLTFQRNMVQQDQLMQNLIQYLVHLEQDRGDKRIEHGAGPGIAGALGAVAGGSSFSASTASIGASTPSTSSIGGLLRSSASTAAGGGASGGPGNAASQRMSSSAATFLSGLDSGPFLPSNEAHKLIGSYTDLARASFAQMNEISQRAGRMSHESATSASGGGAAATTTGARPYTPQQPPGSPRSGRGSISLPAPLSPKSSIAADSPAGGRAHSPPSAGAPGAAGGAKGATPGSTTTPHGRPSEGAASDAPTVFLHPPHFDEQQIAAMNNPMFLAAMNAATGGADGLAAGGQKPGGGGIVFNGTPFGSSNSGEGASEQSNGLRVFTVGALQPRQDYEALEKRDDGSLAGPSAAGLDKAFNKDGSAEKRKSATPSDGSGLQVTAFEDLPKDMPKVDKRSHLATPDGSHASPPDGGSATGSAEGGSSSGSGQPKNSSMLRVRRSTYVPAGPSRRACCSSTTTRCIASLAPSSSRSSAARSTSRSTA